MNSRLKNTFLSGDRQFVILRGISMIMAMVFALIYSKQLGVERRGLLTFVMVTNLVFSIILISGISLHLRNITRSGTSRDVLGNYIAIVLLFSFLTPILNFLVLEAYQDIFKTFIPKNLIYACILYCFFSTLSYGMHDALLLIKSVKVASVMDLGVVLIQIASYLTLVYAGETSYFVSVLISNSISYLVMVSATLLLLIYIHNPKISLSSKTLKKLFRDSTTPTLINMSGQLLERIDKVFIGLQTTSADLGRYSTSQSIFSLSRFIPDALTKLTIARDRNFLKLRKFGAPSILLFVLLGIFGTGVANKFIGLFLGNEWRLPLIMLFTLGAVEMFRGIHSLVVMNAVRANQYRKLKQVTVIQLFVGLGVQPVAIHFLGLWGSLTCSLVILLIGIVWLKAHSYE